MYFVFPAESVQCWIRNGGKNVDCN